MTTSFERACARADAKAMRQPRDPETERLRALLDDNVSLDRAYALINAHHFRGRAAESTVEALVYDLREHGLDALKRPGNARRLSDLSDEQLATVNKRTGLTIKR